MPIYEYECEHCGVLEVWQRMSEGTFRKCRKDWCQSPADCPKAIRRLVSAPSLQFKGTGWYVTDYGKSGGSEKPEKSGDSPPTGADSGEKKSKEKVKDKPKGKTEGAAA